MRISLFLSFMEDKKRLTLHITIGKEYDGNHLQTSVFGSDPKILRKRNDYRVGWTTARWKELCTQTPANSKRKGSR